MKVQAQDVVKGKTYSDGKRVFKIRKATAQGDNHTQIVTTGGGLLNLSNTADLFDSANDIK